jgi:hypothetical protein
MAANGAWLVQSEHVATASAVCAAMNWNGIAPRIKVVSSTAAHLIVNTPSVFKSSFAFSLFSVPEGHLTTEELQRWLSHTSAVILGMGSAFGNQKSMAIVTTSSLGCDKDVGFAVEMRLNHEIRSTICGPYPWPDSIRVARECFPLEFLTPAAKPMF